ncbi:MAG: hypothetical protein JW798_05825 [Prolixibacteraceae bacterium]|nr:hypothetical protein [Prolixibacteraceae bacterium]
MKLFSYKIIFALFAVQLILLNNKPAMAQEKWYKPVNIGCYSLNFVPEKEIGTDELYNYLSEIPGNFYSEQFERELNQAMSEWKNDSIGLPPIDLENDPYYNSNPDRKLEYMVAGFSDNKVNLHIYFEFGSSRWHHYLALLANLILPRSEKTDSLLNMKYYDELYKTTFMGLSHGSSLKDVKNSLGTGYSEYIGQNLQLQNIYFKKYNIEICLQDRIVKYIKKGKPGWMDSDNVIKRY